MKGGFINLIKKEYSTETFSAKRVEIIFKGINIHPGAAKNILINSQKIASKFITLLPDNMSPEKTDNYDGFIHPYSVIGNEEETKVSLIVRDFDNSLLDSKINFLKNLTLDVLKMFF
jgi:tripeptide aminopeptidase